MKKSEIIKKYHFYAAHRNKELEGKCSFMHGHTYIVKVVLSFDSYASMEAGVLIPFEDIDNALEPIIKSLDHSTLINTGDTELMNAVDRFPSIFGKVCYMPDSTSVENLCKLILRKIKLSSESIYPYVYAIKIQETTSSEVVIYS